MEKPKPQWCFKDPEIRAYAVKYSDESVEETPATNIAAMRKLAATEGLVLVRDKANNRYRFRAPKRMTRKPA